MDSIDEVLAGYEGIQAGQEAFYQDLHAHPELSHAEHRTAEHVAGKLQEYGFSVAATIPPAVNQVQFSPQQYRRALLDALDQTNGTDRALEDKWW